MRTDNTHPLRAQLGGNPRPRICAVNVSAMTTFCRVLAGIREPPWSGKINA
jgi:hypothetical protein